MQLPVSGLLRAYPQVKDFLGTIVDSGELPGLSEAEREAMIAELGNLLMQRVTAYFETSLDDVSLERLQGIVAEAGSDCDVYAQLRAVIPQFDADLERLCLAFHAEYAVGGEK